MKLRMRFGKEGIVKFIGHLDIMRYFQKAFRRANVDITYSQGYHPHPCLSFASPLGAVSYTHLGIGIAAAVVIACAAAFWGIRKNKKKIG